MVQINSSEWTDEQWRVAAKALAEENAELRELITMGEETVLRLQEELANVDEQRLFEIERRNELEEQLAEAQEKIDLLQAETDFRSERITYWQNKLKEARVQIDKLEQI